MTMRTIVGLSWSFISGLAGVWLLLSPWTLGEQHNGDWTMVTRTQFGTGLGLAVLGGIGATVVVTQVVGALRESGVLRRPVARTAATGAASPDSTQEMEQVLVSLASALAADLNRQQQGARPVPPAEVPGAPAPPVGPTARADAGWRGER
ncbi:MAG TPA: hypothetical protein VFD49_07300 [Candidatus Dormibacteraeota bacterium]|nr:hypothetical protein [Candidatus Dormibacteraeota bacterium]